MTESAEECAFHEAGHAIVALALGIVPFSAEIDPTYARGYGGRCGVPVGLPVEIQVCISLAGMYGERLVNGIEPSEEHLGGTGDRLYARQLLEREALTAPPGTYDVDARYAELGLRTAHLVNDHREEIEATAATLLERAYITGGGIVMISRAIRSTNGETFGPLFRVDEAEILGPWRRLQEKRKSYSPGRPDEDTSSEGKTG